MSNLLLSDCIAELFLRAGVELVTYVPGFGANEVFASINQRYRNESKGDFPISFHEEVAYTIAHGASLLGARTCCVIKTHGFEKAANSIIHSLYSGTNGALLTFLFEDTDGSHSDNILDIEPLLQGSKVPYLRSSAQSIAKDFCFAISESERLKLPFIIVINADQVNESCSLEDFPQVKQNPNQYKRDIYDHVVCPFTAEFQYKVLEAKLKNQNWHTLPKPNKSLNPQVLSEVQRGWVEKYEAFFKVFQKFRGNLVTGDASTPSIFALPPYNCIDIVTYFGGSVPLALGAMLQNKVPNKNIWAVSGDFAFLAAGHLGLIEALQRKLPLKLILFCNQQAGATGGQSIEQNILKTILAGYQEFVVQLDQTQDESAIEKALLEAQNSPNMRILLLNYR